MAVQAFQHGRYLLEPYILPVLIGSALAVGLLRGKRLAWQWARLLGPIAAVITGVNAVFMLDAAARHPGENWQVQAGLLVLQSACLLVMFFALGTKSARKHFELICPRCRSTQTRAANPLFSEAYCRRCDTVW